MYVGCKIRYLEIIMVDDEEIRPVFDFAFALFHLREGYRLTRRNWNGKGMFIYLVPSGAYPAATMAAENYFAGRLVPYSEYFAMKTAQGYVTPWVASHTDLLALDWEIVK